MKDAPLDGTIIMGKIYEVFDQHTVNEIDRIRFVKTNHKYMKNFWVRSDWSYCEPISWKPAANPQDLPKTPL